jgi:hypothetical protein
VGLSTRNSSREPENAKEVSDAFIFALETLGNVLKDQERLPFIAGNRRIPGYASPGFICNCTAKTFTWRYREPEPGNENAAAILCNIFNDFHSRRTENEMCFLSRNNSAANTRDPFNIDASDSINSIYNVP